MGPETEGEGQREGGRLMAYTGASRACKLHSELSDGDSSTSKCTSFRGEKMEPIDYML